jgi:heme-degrading monooxygenase HmoA
VPEKNQMYTVGLWTTKPGNEQAFITEWKSFAQWTERNQSGSRTGYLLRDRNSPGKFISFGPWENEEAINRWRESPEFKAFVLKARELCTDFQPQSMVLVADSRLEGSA